MPRVIVVGGANADIKGRASEPFVAGSSNPGVVTVSAGGVGRNIAENLARLGIDVGLVTVLGDDANGEMLRKACAAAGVDLSLALTGPDPTGTYLAILDDRGEMVSAVNDMRAIAHLGVADLEARSAALAACDMIVADCNIAVPCLAWLAAFASARRIRLLIEPVSVAKASKLLAFTRHEPVFAITPNVLQIEALTGETDEARALPRLHALGFANIVLHRGGAGAVASSGAAVKVVAPHRPNDVADVTGAGDAAVAGLVCGLLEGLPLARAAALGQAAAAIKLGSRESVSSALSRDRLRALAGF